MTNAQLKHLYKTYNKKYFGNKLDSHMIVRFVRSSDPLPKRYLGGALWRSRLPTSRSASQKPGYYKILVRRGDGQVIAKQTLLHEMCHVAIGRKFNHGPRFNKEIDKLYRAGAYNGLL